MADQPPIVTDLWQGPIQLCSNLCLPRKDFHLYKLIRLIGNLSLAAQYVCVAHESLLLNPPSFSRVKRCIWKDICSIERTRTSQGLSSASSALAHKHNGLVARVNSNFFRTCPHN